MNRTCENGLRKGCKRHVMIKYVGRRKGGKIKWMHGSGTRT